MMMLAPGFSAQCDVLTTTCDGEEIDGIGTVESDSMSDGRPVFECVHARIVVGAMMFVCDLVLKNGDLMGEATRLYRAAPVNK
jgi:hypothetical protein